MDVEVITVPAMHVAYTRFEGPLDKVGPAFERMQAFVEGDALAQGPLVGVFREHRQPLDAAGRPHGAAVGEAEVWVRYAGKTDADMIDVKEVPATRVASTRFVGNPEDLLRFQDALRRFLRKEGLRLSDETRHVYHRADPESIEDWETEVQVVLVPQ